METFESLRGQPRFRLFTARQIALAGLCGAGAAGWWLLAANAVNLGRRGLAWKLRAAAVMLTAVVAAVWLPMSLFALYRLDDWLTGRMRDVRPDVLDSLSIYILWVASDCIPSLPALAVFFFLLGIAPPTLGGLITLRVLMGGVIASHNSRRGPKGEDTDWWMAVAKSWLIVALLIAAVWYLPI